MNWKQFIKEIETKYPGVKPDKLLPFVERMLGKKTNPSDFETISGEWSVWVLKVYNKGLGIPERLNKNKLPVQHRIRYLIKHKSYRFSWEMFHPVYYNDKVGVSDSEGNFTGEVIIEKTLGPRKINHLTFIKIKHQRNLTRILQRAKIIK